jgi:RNA polymerase sigma-70 factor (ECF subfamily)
MINQAIMGGRSMPMKGELVLEQRPPDTEAEHAEAAQERRWVQAARQGNRLAFDALVECHIDKVAAVARQFLQDPQEVEDAVQETFVRAFQSLRDFRGDARLRTWLIRIAVNVCKNRRGSFWARFVRSGQEETVFDIAAGDAQKLAETALLETERSQDLAKALLALPEKFRRPIVLHFFEDLSGAEIAIVLGWNESTVWSRLYAGLKALRKHLEATDL